MLRGIQAGQVVQTQGAVHRMVSIIIAQKAPHVMVQEVGLDIIDSQICHQAAESVIYIMHTRGDV
ncbi:hypothetical protein D3C77_709530 [compost metagenome]